MSKDGKNLYEKTNRGDEVIDERTKLGLFLYELERLNLESKTAVFMNNRLNFLRGMIIYFYTFK